MVGILPDITDPSQLAPAPTQAPKAGGFGSAFDGLLAQFDRMEAESGPLVADIARGFFEAEMRSIGAPIQIQSKQERELQAVQLQLAQQELVEKSRTAKARAVITDLLTAGPDLSDTFGIRVDASLLDNPEALIDASRKFAKLTGRADVELNLGDLFLADISSLSRQVDSPEEVQGQQLQQRQSAARAEADIVERTSQIQSGDSENATVALLRQNLAAAEQQTGQDIGNGEDLFFDDLDEPRGAAGVVQAILSTVAQSGDQATALTGILTGDDVGKRISSIIKGASELGEDGKRRIRRDDSEALPALLYVGLVDRAAQEIQGADAKSLFLRMGLEDFAVEDVEAGRNFLR